MENITIFKHKKRSLYYERTEFSRIVPEKYEVEWIQPVKGKNYKGLYIKFFDTFQDAKAFVNGNQYKLITH